MILCGILGILGINDNNIISSIPNVIPDPKSLRYVVKKSHLATFMSVAGFVCNYPCRMSCDKGEHADLGCMVKYISFWCGELVQSIYLDAGASKGSSEQVTKAFSVSLNQIYTYRFDGERTLLLVKTTESDGG